MKIDFLLTKKIPKFIFWCNFFVYHLYISREGHALPPNLIRYCEPTGENILAAGRDSSLHIMNTVTETFNKSMGKASYNKKASKKKSMYS